MEKLRGFTCLTEPSVRSSDTEREEKKPESVQPPRDVTDQHSDKTKRLQQPEEEEEEEVKVKEKQSSGLAASKQVPDINVNSLHVTVITVSFELHVGSKMKVQAFMMANICHPEVYCSAVLLIFLEEGEQQK